MPIAVVAAIIMFSVAPTLGNGKTILLAYILLSQLQLIQLSTVCSFIPNIFNPYKCRSIGLLPISHPPGVQRHAFFIRAETGAKNIIEERISLIISSGISHLSITVVSTISVSFSLVTFAPKYSKISQATETSLKSGQLCMTFFPFAIIVAAKMGKTEFFAPCNVTSPSSLFPPFTMNLSIFTPLCHRFIL